jgi:hypothetical protein
MATFGALKRNLRRNITPYNETEGADIGGFASRIISYLLAILFALSVIFITMPTAANIIFRVPDLYSFDLSRTGILKEASLDVKTSKVGGVISDYMMHKTDDFQLTAKFQGRAKPVFTIGDGAAMQKLRRVLDGTVPAVPAGLAVFLIAFICLYKMQRFKYLRRAFGAAWVIYVLTLIGLAVALYYGDVKMQIWHDILGIRLSGTDMLPGLFGSGYFLSAYISVTVISLVIMIVCGSVTFALTRNKDRMFD